MLSFLPSVFFLSNLFFIFESADMTLQIKPFIIFHFLQNSPNFLSMLTCPLPWPYTPFLANRTGLECLLEVVSTFTYYVVALPHSLVFLCSCVLSCLMCLLSIQCTCTSRPSSSTVFSMKPFKTSSPPTKKGQSYLLFS